MGTTDYTSAARQARWQAKHKAEFQALKAKVADYEACEADAALTAAQARIVELESRIAAHAEDKARLKRVEAENRKLKRELDRRKAEPGPVQDVPSNGQGTRDGRRNEYSAYLRTLSKDDQIEELRKIMLGKEAGLRWTTNEISKLLRMTTMTLGPVR
jgi:hypothetical protein